ncbi:hypothetical protein AGMMS49944_29370 [Spirochaetia bacterium]|nr:hypothetical protein AGMMS49944_29370 [Spirochaetia bacterium]
MRKLKFLGLPAIALALGVTFLGCGGDDDGSPGPLGGGTQYTVTYNVGSGSGDAPASQTVAAGTAITLPGQGSMVAPSGQTFDGWNDSFNTYQQF